MTDVLQPPSGAGSSPSTVEQPADLPSRMTFEEFLTWDQEGIRAEWVDGEVMIVSPVSLDHQRVLQFVYEILAAFVRQHDLGEIFLAPVLMHLPSRPSGREPDLLFVAAAHSDRLLATFVEGPADLVVEVMSPESEVRDRAVKLLEYEAARIPEYWLFDPLRREALFHVLGEDGRYHVVLPDSAGFYRSQVVEGFRLRVEWLWQRPLPTPEVALREILG